MSVDLFGSPEPAREEPRVLSVSELTRAVRATLEDHIGQVWVEGEISNYTFTQIAPTSTGDPNQSYTASSTRLTITVRVTYVNTLDETMSFKDKSFSFYKDFSNDENISDVEEADVRQIFDRIVNDIFNASIANW